MNDYAFLKYQAKLTNTGHAEDEGELVRCIIRMKNVDQGGNRLHDIELHQQAGDNVLFVINPGPHHAISHSSFWNVTEEELHKLEKLSVSPSWGLRDLFLQRLMTVKCTPVPCSWRRAVRRS
jgi:hypothetical protein